jgi:DNA-binding IclR family transcriptional regulator
MAQAPIRAVARAFDIIETIQVRNGAGVSELADELDMAKSTVHAHLRTLTDRGYLEQDADNRYHLSLSFLTLGGSVRHSGTIFEHVEPLLTEIASETGESVKYVVESGGKLTSVGSILGEDGIRTEVDIGFRTELHTVPEGKLVLAHLPDGRRQTLIDDIDFPIDNAVGRAAFTAELEEIREEGIAYGHETIIKNVTSVSVPVIDDEGTFYGAVVVAGPSMRFTEERIESVTETLRFAVSKLNIDTTYERQESIVENRIRTS